VTKLTRNSAGEFLYEEAGRQLTVSGYASGMQRAIFSTAIKLSLAASVGTPFRVMLFDEITAAAGDEVSLQFTSLLASAGKQVICVTHRAADAAAADHVIEL
jgi:DNA repair ATPase RecN